MLTHNHRWSVALIAALIAAWALGISGTCAASPTARPNIVIFVIDELRYDEISALRQAFIRVPNIDALAKSGMSLTRYYAVAPICSPNRASMLTGQYPPVHGIVDNTDRSRLSHQLQTFAMELRSAGYDTGYIGKWHMGNDPTPRPGFDYWAALPGQGRITDPEIFEDGRLHTVPGYVTDILTDRAVAFLQRPREAPFMLYLAHKAIHPDARQLADSSVDLDFGIRYVPAPRHQGVYVDEPVSKRPSTSNLEEDLAGKPVIRRALQRKRSKEVVDRWGSILDSDATDETIRLRAEMLLSVDDSVGRVVDVLRRQGQLDNTMIIFTSDNAGFAGEHGLTIERRLPYEEVIRLPMIVAYPGFTQPGSTTDSLVLSVDIAPTVLAAAGIEGSYPMQGQSFIPVLKGQAPADWQDSFIIEHRPDERPFSWLADLQYVAVRQRDLKLIHWIRYPRESELYDLAADPYERRNVFFDPAYAQQVPALQEELRRLLLAERWLAPQ